MNIMLNSKCKTHGATLIPWPFLQHKKNLMHSKFDLYFLSLHVSIAIFMLELVQFPSNEKNLQKNLTHSLIHEQ